MKQTFLTIAAALLMCVPTFAQQASGKVDVAALQKKIEKSDAEIANEKKASKPSTWTKRADLLVEAHTAYTGKIYEGMEGTMILMMLGDPSAQEQAEIEGTPYLKLVYDGYSLYLDANQKVRGWEVKEPVYENAAMQAADAYQKAYEMNPKLLKKTAQGFVNITSALQKEAGNYFFLRDFKRSSESFEAAYKASLYPAANAAIDTLSLYNAGFTGYFAGDYERSVQHLLKAEELGFYQDGEIYNVLYNAYRSFCGEDKEKLAGAKEFLLRGLQLFPGNSSIVTCLTDLYLALGESPEEIVPMVKSAVDADPNNSMLWYGLGSVYTELKMYDDAQAAFRKVVELDPNNSTAYYYIGHIYVLKGDQINEEVNAMPWTGKENYDREYRRVLDTYALAMEPMEKAYELEPTQIAFSEYLKVIAFKVRDLKPEYMEKYEKYNEIYKQLSSQQ